MTDDRAIARPGRLTRAVVRASSSTTSRIEKVLASEELTLDQWLVMDALAAERGQPMAALVEGTRVSGPTLTRVVDRLVSRALVYREVDVHDRRVVRVHLSRRGHALYRRIAVKVGEVEDELLARAGGAEALLVIDRLAD
ncbi:MarR family winged helix-turn-helix transcriptional regulator [Pseudonocardia sp. ICBG162]|uniref:MarR family winged helix-turn-helix transcriptional regulator n=1 Tax=Pseudonocardia sp. ICBG162 TaxID=2846761 RepID=UPI001CF67A19|nr:MarR family transcriptional regulator [Pseudonocardia sp. ICBG162]